MMVRHELKLAIVVSLDRLQALYGALPLWTGNPKDIPQVTVHSSKSAGGTFDLHNPRWLTPHIIGMFEEMLDAWPGAPAVSRAFLQSKAIPHLVNPGEFVHAVNAVPPTVRRVRTSAEWERIAPPDVHFADLVAGLWIVANPAWLA